MHRNSPCQALVLPIIGPSFSQLCLSYKVLQLVVGAIGKPFLGGGFFLFIFPQHCTPREIEVSLLQ